MGELQLGTFQSVYDGAAELPLFARTCLSLFEDGVIERTPIRLQPGVPKPERVGRVFPSCMEGLGGFFGVKKFTFGCRWCSECKSYCTGT